MDPAEFARVGAELVELGGKLNEKKAARDALNKEITELEEQIRPLMVEHQKMLAELVGVPVQAVPPPGPPPPTPPNGNGNGNGGPPKPPFDPNTAIKQRIIAFLNRSEPGVSALEVADALKIDVSLVRQAMNDLMRQGAGRMPRASS
jgi:predicted ArsR family transcriptional regulator